MHDTNWLFSNGITQTSGPIVHSHPRGRCMKFATNCDGRHRPNSLRRKSPAPGWPGIRLCRARRHAHIPSMKVKAALVFAAFVLLGVSACETVKTTSAGAVGVDRK